MRELGPNASHPLNELTSLPCIKNVTAYVPSLGGENGQSNQINVCVLWFGWRSLVEKG